MEDSSNKKRGKYPLIMEHIIKPFEKYNNSHYKLLQKSNQKKIKRVLRKIQRKQIAKPHGIVNHAP